MYGLELNVWAGFKYKGWNYINGLKYTGWNKMYGLELSVWAGIKYMGLNEMYGLELIEQVVIKVMARIKCMDLI